MGCSMSAVKATEQGTYVVVASFYDEAGAPIVPKTAAWTLTDEDGAVINSRSAVALTPAAAIPVVMSGNDLKRSDGTTRVLLVAAVYDSLTLGNDLPLKAEFWFEVADLVAVT